MHVRYRHHLCTIPHFLEAEHQKHNDTQKSPFIQFLTYLTSSLCTTTTIAGSPNVQPSAAGERTNKSSRLAGLRDGNSGARGRGEFSSMNDNRYGGGGRNQPPFTKTNAFNKRFSSDGGIR